jgi:hypothetical protein
MLSKEEIIKQRLEHISSNKVNIYRTTVLNKKTGKLEEIEVEKHTGNIFRANTIVNNFTDFIEVIYYKEPFDYVTDRKELLYNELGEKLLKENPRRFMYDNGDLIPRMSIDWDKVEDSNMKSLHRSKDNFYAYVLCNRWKYFVTFTFDPKKIDRYNKDKVKQAYKIFRQQLQRIDKNVTMIVVPEGHKDVAIHFHGFIGNIDLSPYLGILYDKNCKPKKSKCGEQLYNISLFKYGFNTLAILPDDYNVQRVANYCIAYVTKSERIGYNKKAYFRTTNLNYKGKVVSYFTDAYLDKLRYDLEVTKYKENDKMIVYRKMKI